MARPRRKKGVRRRKQEKIDMISQLPDEVLCSIISSLSIDEAVRSSVLSKRWKPLWKRVSCLDFDGRQMIKPLSQLKNSISTSKVTFDPNRATKKDAIKYGKLVYHTLNQHLGDITACRFRHFSQSLDFGEVEAWIEFVVLENKRLSSLSLECEPLIKEVNHMVSDASRKVKPNFQHGIFSNLSSLELTNYALNSSASYAFERCEKLKRLKLKKIFMKDNTVDGILKNCLGLEDFSLVESAGFRKLKIQNQGLKALELQWLVVDEIDVFAENLQDLVLNSLICPTKGLSFFAPNLNFFLSGCNAIAQKIQARSHGQQILKTQDILENCSDLLGSQTTSIFRNLLTLSIDLDLNNIREAMALSFILRSCFYLKTLEITLPVGEDSNSNGSSDDCTLPFPNSLFWDRQEMYNCINHQLKYAKINGFTGKEQEVKFVKHLITRANMIKRISVICDTSIVDEATSLLSLPRASVYLIITLEAKIKKHLNEVAEIQGKLSQLRDIYPF
ncbi:hypothetical protein VNO77_28014 [Canavalia gladiata]|uniref:F-box domain-containing protein n=1 Tax=Canavalia gladiata TaxID=3824 RepID=A0AAN9Q7L1_CANGL